MKLDLQYTDTASNNSAKILIYAPSGQGKTHTASTLAGKTLVISLEAGHLTLRPFHIPMYNLNSKPLVDEKNKPVLGPTGIPLTTPLEPSERLEKLGAIYKSLKEKKEYDNIFIDSITELSECVLSIVQKEFPDRKDSFPMWGEYGKRMRSIIKSFRDLEGYNVIMTCLSEVDKDENNRRFMACDVAGKIGKQLPQFFDEVFYVYRNPEGDYRFYTKKTDTNVSKDRSGKLDEDIPADLGAAMLKIFENKKEEKK